MTIPVLSWRGFILKSKLQPTTKHVLLTLACHMNDAGESCYPSIQMLMDETGLSKQTLITHLRISVENGWIGSSKLGFAGQRWSRNQYWITYPPEVEDQIKGGQPIRPPSPGKAVNLADEGGQPNHKKAVKQVDLISSLISPDNSPAPSNARTPEQILWDHTKSMFTGISEQQMDEWEKAYPTLDIDGELNRIEIWYQLNPKKRKRDIRRFITNWLARTFDDLRKPKVFASRPPPPAGPP